MLNLQEVYRELNMNQIGFKEENTDSLFIMKIQINMILN